MQSASLNSQPKDFFLTGTILALLATAATASFIMTSKGNKPTKIDIPETEGEKNLPDDLEVLSFTNRRSQSLRTVTMRARGDVSTPKARVVFITGLTDHCTRGGYVRMYESLASEGVDVHAMDLHGQGRSEGLPRSYCNSFDDYIDDAEDFVVKCRGDGDGSKVPLILMGQSLGGLIAAHTAIQIGTDNIAGLIATSPCYSAILDMLKKIQLSVVPVLDTLMPKAKLVDAVRPEDLTRDAKEVQLNKDDKLIVHGKTPVRTGRLIINAMNDLKKTRKDIKCPVLIIHGTKDKITSIEGSIDFYKNIGTPKENKCFLRCPGLYHEVFNEPEKDFLLKEISKFASSGGTKLPDKTNEDADGIVDADFSSS